MLPSTRSGERIVIVTRWSRGQAQLPSRCSNEGDVITTRWSRGRVMRSRIEDDSMRAPGGHKLKHVVISLQCAEKSSLKTTLSKGRTRIEGRSGRRTVG